MIARNKIYFYLSQRLLEYFISGRIAPGSRYQIKLENVENVAELYKILKLTVGQFQDQGISLGNYDYNDFQTYYIDIKGIRLIVTNNVKGDFLTGLRNNFQRVKDFEKTSAVLFIHCSELESMGKGVLELSTKDGPLNYNTISNHVIDSFKNAKGFSPTQKYFLTELISGEAMDYEMENSNVFDLRKYLDILLAEKLTKENYLELGVFYDSEIQENNLSNQDVRIRAERNGKIFSDISRQEELGNLKNYLEKHFDTKGQNALAKRENWPNVDYKDVDEYLDNKKNKPFNEYISHHKLLNSQSLKIWERDESRAGSKSKSRNFSLVIFNPDHLEDLDVNLHLKKSLRTAKITTKIPYEISSFKRALELSFHLSSPERFVAFDLLIEEEIEKKTNKINFKILILPFAESIIREINSNYSVEIDKQGLFKLVMPIEQEILLNASSGEQVLCEVSPNGAYELNPLEALLIRVHNRETLESSRVDFKLRYGYAILPCSLIIAEVQRNGISGAEVWRRKNELAESFRYSIKFDDSDGTMLLEQANEPFYPVGEFRNTLILEDKLIAAGFPICEQDEHGNLLNSDEVLPEDLAQAYSEIIDFYNAQREGIYILPSTAYIADELKLLYEQYVACYFMHLNRIADNASLPPQYRSLLKIGTITEIGMLRSLKIGPLHPLMVCYQLKVSSIMEKDFLDKDNNEMLKGFGPNHLLPFVTNGTGDREFYIGAEQEHSPEWLYFVNAAVPGQSINRRNVPEMMSSKIKEFINHFSYYYIDTDAPIRINLFNVGDGKESLQGIFEYFSISTKALVASMKNPSDVLPLRINIYGAERSMTCFEQFSKFEDPLVIKDKFGIDLKALRGKMEIEDFLKLYQQKVQYFIKKRDGAAGEELEYAHLSFHQFSERDIKQADINSSDVPSGLSLGGLTADLPAVNLHGEYKTGFGTRFLDGQQEDMLIAMAKKLNALAYINNTSKIFKEDRVFSSLIDSSVRAGLKKLYDSSQWVIYINPGADLSFFKKDDEVAIIHYADQYSNSTNFDSITITTKFDQYEAIIKRYLDGKVDRIEGSVMSIINMYNALNGYWLLKLGAQGQTDHVNKEKISILSAVKEALAILDHPDITWVALSLEEILRVTGAAKLKKKVGIFSIANLNKKGAYSDDLLMVGTHVVDDQLRLYFYPIEVKTGNNDAGVIEKAGKQGKNTFDLLIQTLAQPGLKGRVYRNYFAKLILNAAQKLSLYGVWPEYSHKWDDLVHLRGRLLDDDFIVASLREYVGDYGVLSFKKNDTHGKRSIILDDDQLNINLYASDGLNDLLMGIDLLKARYAGMSTFDDLQANLLSTVYKDPVERNLVEEYQQSSQEENGEDLQDEDDDELYPEVKPIMRRVIAIDDLDEELPDVWHDKQESTPFQQESPSKLNEPLSVATKEIPVKIPVHTTAIPTVSEKGPLKILFGNRVSNGQPVEWFPTSANKVSHTNTGIIGTMGTGKTQFTKSLITQLVRNSKDNVGGKKIGILIFDYKGDYVKEDFVKATGAKVYDLHQLPFNPFSLSVGKQPKKLLPLHTASTFQETIKKAFNLGNKQDLALFETIMEAYSNAGILKGDASTWDRPAPTMKDVVEIYMDRDKVAKDSLFAALQKLYNFEFFEPNPKRTTPLFDLIDGVTIINLEKNSADIQNLIVAITLDQFYAQMQTAGSSQIDGSLRQINKMILVDEADNFMSKNFESLRKILKEGREYGVGTILSTQFLNHFTTTENEYSSYILTWIMHKVSEIKDKEIYTIFDMPNRKDRDELVAEIKGLEIHHSIVYTGSGAPVQIKDRAFWELLRDEDIE